MLAEKSLCTGCGACYSACAFNAIKMTADKTGFLYPEIDKELCKNCSACAKACPVISPVQNEKCENPGCFVFQYNDDKIRKESTSGGAFTAIAEYVIRRGGVVFGASFDENLCVRHTFAESISDLSQFRNSKYVQSEIRDTYKEAKAFLEEGRWVCFSGTPCQIHALVNYLKKPYEKLVTVDLICLAVPSPKIFKMYLDFKKEKLSKVKKVWFRNKDLGYSYPTMLIEGEKKKYRSGSESDEWLRLFLKKYTTRSSCADCMAQKNRCSDFTIYDCNNIYEKYPEIDDDKGASNILVHTRKAREMFLEIQKGHTVIKNTDSLSKSNSKKAKATRLSEEVYEKFYDDSDILSPKEFFKKYAPVSFKIRFKRFARVFTYKIGIYKKVRAFIRARR